MDIKVLQLHKKASIEYKHIQDKYNFSTSNNCIALSDGTTQSFKSELWASMLVENFVNNPLFEVNLLKEEFKKLAANFKDTDFEFSSNFAKASLEKAKKAKGGTATFIGLQFINHNSIKVLNCGDSCLFLFRDNKINSFPFKTLEELDKNNHFINSNKLLEDEIENDFFNFDEISILNNDIIILATDAVSRLIFRKPESISLILKCNNFEELKSFCETSWENKELEEDDISIVIIYPNSSNKIIEIIPPKEFCFPQIEEKEFIPSLENQNFINNIESLEMEQLNRMIQQLFRETDFLKSKLKLTQALLISTLALLIINSLFLYFIYKKSSIVSEVNNKNQASTQLDVNEPVEEVEDLNSSSDKELINSTTTGETIVEDEELNKEKNEKDTKKEKINKEKKNTNSKTENVNSIPKLEDEKKNNIIKAETKKDSIKS